MFYFVSKVLSKILDIYKNTYYKIRHFGKKTSWKTPKLAGRKFEKRLSLNKETGANIKI